MNTHQMHLSQAAKLSELVGPLHEAIANSNEQEVLETVSSNFSHKHWAKSVPRETD